MDSAVGRVQAGFGKFTSTASVAGVVIALLGLFQLWYDGGFGLQSSVGPVKSSMTWQSHWRYGAPPKGKKENARFEFDLDADLTPLFNWNTKQVFAYVTVDYNSTSRRTGEVSSNSVVIWDKIITEKESAKLALRKQKSKYSVWDARSDFGGDEREVQVTLRYNVQPHVGFLVNGKTEVSGGRVQLPPLEK